MKALLKKSLCFLIVLFILFSFNCYAVKTLVTQHKEAKEWFEKAYNVNSSQLKIEYYTKAIELDPEYAQAYYNRGEVFNDLDKYQKAIDDYSKVIEIDPSYTSAYSCRENAYKKLEECQNANSGNIKIISTPSNSSIWIDGKYKGNTPKTLENFSPGTYQLRLSKIGYQVNQQNVTVSSDKTTEVFATLTLLSPYSGKIKISSTPSSAKIYLDGYYKGTTPRTINDVPPGSHTLKITKTGYEDVTKKITVTAGKTVSVSTELPKKLTTLEVTSTPSGAKVYINDIHKGITPFKNYEILPATYRLKISKAGYQTWYKTVEVKSNQINKIHADLTSISGSLYISSFPSESSIYLDGSYEGATPKTIEDIPPGSHTLKITRPGYEDWTKDVEVTAGKTTSVSADLVAFPNIELTDIPPGAQIYLNDNLKGSTEETEENNTFTLNQVPFGKHQIKVTKSGYQTFTADIDISSSKPLSLPVTLKKADSIIPLLLALILPALVIIYYLFILPIKRNKKKERQEEKKETIENLPPIKKEDMPEGITETLPEQNEPLPDDPVTREYQEIQEKMEEQANIRTLLSQTQEETEKAITQAKKDNNSSQLSSLKDLKQKINDLSQQFEYGKLSSEKVNNEIKLIKNQMKELSKKGQAIKGIKPKELNKKTREIREKKRE